MREIVLVQFAFASLPSGKQPGTHGARKSEQLLLDGALSICRHSAQDQTIHKVIFMDCEQHHQNDSLPAMQRGDEISYLTGEITSTSSQIQS